MAWEVEATDELRAWYWGLDPTDQEGINGAIDLLQRHGPALTRPLADRIASSRHHNLKELRPPATNIRILFVFDPRRTAILLLGGDKTDRWTEWYRLNVPIADRLYDEYLESLRREGLLP